MHELENHIFKPTRIQYFKKSLQVRSATLIDIIASNVHENECRAGNLQYPDGDHFATFKIFHKYFNRDRNIEKEAIYKRKLDAVDSNNLTCDFNEINWNNLVYNEPDLDKAVNNLVNSLEDTYLRGMLH